MQFRENSRIPTSAAVVIGGSMAGMLAARVLSDYFEQVTILEQDTYPDGAESRPGVPQARHLHALLSRGHSIVEKLFPGITEQWRQAGARLLDVSSDFAWRTPAGWAVRFDSRIEMLAASRALIDAAVLKRMRAIPNIAIVENASVHSLTGSGGRVCGVRVWAADETHIEIPADLVVEASGRMSRAPEWLEELGYERPTETVINAHLGYATRLYRRVPDAARDWRALYIQAAPPDQKRAGIAFPIEDDRWIVTLCGGDRDYAPTNETEFLAFARSLPDRRIADLIAGSEPVSRITGYRRMENRWRHYERLRKRPEGFLITGDAVCAFNPVYGQGMTVAAMEAETLARCLDESRGAGLATRFQKALAKVIRTPWTLATGEDVRYRGVEGARPGFADRAMHWYIDRVVAASTSNTEVRRRLLRVFTMLDGPEALFSPAVLAPSLMGAVARAIGTLQAGSRHHEAVEAEHA